MLNKMNNNLKKIFIHVLRDKEAIVSIILFLLNNNNLLEILGQFRNSEEMQPHMEKCFDNFMRFDLSRITDNWDATHINSAGGEKSSSPMQSVCRVEVMSMPIKKNLSTLRVRDLFSDTMQHRTPSCKICLVESLKICTTNTKGYHEQDTYESGLQLSASLY